MHRSLTAALGVLLVLGAASAARAQVIEQIVATVDGEPIWASELVERVEEPSPSAYRAELERMIEERVIEAEAARYSLVVSDEMVHAAITDIRRQNGLEEEPFWQAVEAQGLTRSAYWDQVRNQIMRLQLVQLLTREELTTPEGEPTPSAVELQERLEAAEERVIARLRQRAHVLVRI